MDSLKSLRKMVLSEYKKGACAERRRREKKMKKWILIIIQDRELISVSVYNTFEEAQASMKADFIESVGEDEFNEACLANDDSQYWQLNDDNAWMSQRCNVDWYIKPIVV